MRSAIRFAIAGILLVSSSAHAEAPTPATIDPAAVERATALADRKLDALLGGLKQRLLETIPRGGSAGAIEVCAEFAPALADDLAAEPGVRLGRSGTRLRNPANRGPEWVEAWLATHASHPVAEVEGFSRVASTDAGPTVRVLRPLGVGGLCLLCHGPRENLSPQVTEALAERYPEDRATGYEHGQLRGAAWAEVPLATGP